MDFFEIGAQELFAQMALNLILLISAPGVARIIGVSHQCLAALTFLVSITSSVSVLQLSPVNFSACLQPFSLNEVYEN
jgi:hypothetical protein